ncbi:type II secretion system protein [Acetivibrio mesophilus]|uniref:Prepilin-type N-terminal cleavage/methylation domain-containing protein n=1 Tax=Acetivibrio mesophilus TaxID=2487273 RepID=A0A4Q0I6C4_9FIRM|nr:prepilin-type N-terminal cleavage/methylation domain-containing protein [Acetivibrio mesophilus]ODM25062.1 prepilin-type N-terminal cleavage/methylation domain-containing protein [Clostridium sp. Bc-iso-3]RXE59936.1 prepilin-type N-terminal cleavage/methylation domain-containing protein [Acetivibrio mesophilus]HHV29479.1 prepilin-type N-terminal cleavage/methylation domain-containing protein [Clostridium sp.]
MIRLFTKLNNNKGMTLMELVIALALLGILVVPITMGFMSTLRVSKLIEQQTKVNAVSEVVKDQVSEALLQENYPLMLLEPTPTETEWFIRPFITGAKSTPDVEKSSPNLAVVYSSGARNEEYFYTVSYMHSSCYDSEYPYTYHVIVKILAKNAKGNIETLNTFKIGANVNTTL